MESSTLPQRLAAGKFKNFPCKVVILRRYSRLHSALAIVVASKNILLVLKVLIKLNFTVTSDNSIRDISDKMNEKHDLVSFIL